MDVQLRQLDPSTASMKIIRDGEVWLSKHSIDSHPKVYADIYRLVAEARFAESKKQHTVSGYQSYQRRYEASKSISDLVSKAQQLEAQRYFDTQVTANPSAMKHRKFQSLYPSSKLIAQSKEAEVRLALADAVSQDTPEAYGDFLKRYKDQPIAAQSV